jgi:hypothetical protein
MVNAVDFLLQSQNADGGWGYRVRGMSYVEPTAVVLLALRGRDGTAETRARDFILSLQHADGGWGIGAVDAESGWMTAWAVRALADFEARDAVARGAGWLIATAGSRVDVAATRAQVQRLFQMDGAIRGWPWQPGDASWVHPTALAMLALVAAGQRDHARVREGVLYLYDRAVPSGGWNVGNPRMFDKEIPATIQDTAIALLALRAVGESADNVRIAAAIQFLRGAVARAKTSAELAWGIYSLRGWDVDVGDAVARLNALQSADGSWHGNPFITAIAAIASQK